MNVYPIITTPAIKDCVAFYKAAFEARVLFESDWYAHLAIERWEIGFLAPDPPQKMPVFRHARPSRGLCLAVEVPDVQAMHARLVERGIDTLGKPVTAASGELAFSVVDPSGTVLNFVEIKPQNPDFIEL